MSLTGWLLLLVLPALFGIWLVIRRAHRNTYRLRVTVVKPGATNTSTSLNLLQISDIHLENLSVRPEDIIAAVSDRKIDLIALTGDFLDRRRSLQKLPAYLESLHRLKPELGIYAVLGNHDYVLRAGDLQRLKELFAAHGVQLLQNEHRSVMVGDRRLNIIGIDDFSTGRSDLRRSYHGLGDGYNLVLTHDPNVVLEMADRPFDYLLAGHFHGGQIHWPKPFHLVKMGRLARQRRVRGLHREHGRAFYISEGLGQTGVNLRLGSLPEITIHSLSLDEQRHAEMEIPLSS